jgi:hypothetical protein
MIDSQGKVLGEPMISSQLKSDAKFKGHIVPDPNRPKVSGLILRGDVITIKTDSQLTMIKGKV